MKTMHKIGLGLGAGALTLGGVAGFAQVAQADPTASPTPSASAGTGSGGTSGTDRPDGGKGRHGGERGGQHGHQRRSTQGVAAAAGVAERWGPGFEGWRNPGG